MGNSNFEMEKFEFDMENSETEWKNLKLFGKLRI